MKKTLIRNIYQSLIVVLSLESVLIGFGIYEGEICTDRANYYTYCSVIIIFVYYLSLIVSSYLPKVKMVLLRIKGAMTAMIILTCIVYILGSIVGITKNVSKIENILLHFVIPSMCLIDEIYFTERKVYQKKDFYKYPIIQLIYGVVIYSKVEFFGFSMPSRQSRYPYDLIDPSIVGWYLPVIILAVVLLVFLLGKVMYRINQRLVKQ